MSTEEYGPARCRCGNAAKFGSDWCVECLHGETPTLPLTALPEASEALLLIWAKDYEEMAARDLEHARACRRRAEEMRAKRGDAA